MGGVWRTRFEPLPDITAHELAIDRKYVNASEIVAEWNFKEMGTSLRHRVCDETGRRMDEVADSVTSNERVSK
jgi:hypothetical protein